MAGWGGVRTINNQCSTMEPNVSLYVTTSKYTVFCSTVEVVCVCMKYLGNRTVLSWYRKQKPRWAPRPCVPLCFCSHILFCADYYRSRCKHKERSYINMKTQRSLGLRREWCIRTPVVAVQSTGLPCFEGCPLIAHVTLQALSYGLS